MATDTVLGRDLFLDGTTLWAVRYTTGGIESDAVRDTLVAAKRSEEVQGPVERLDRGEVGRLLADATDRGVVGTVRGLVSGTAAADHELVGDVSLVVDLTEADSVGPAPDVDALADATADLSWVPVELPARRAEANRADYGHEEWWPRALDERPEVARALVAALTARAVDGGGAGVLSRVLRQYPDAASDEVVDALAATVDPAGETVAELRERLTDIHDAVGDPADWEPGDRRRAAETLREAGWDEELVGSALRNAGGFDGAVALNPFADADLDGAARALLTVAEASGRGVDAAVRLLAEPALMARFDGDTAAPYNRLKDHRGLLARVDADRAASVVRAHRSFVDDREAVDAYEELVAELEAEYA